MTALIWYTTIYAITLTGIYGSTFDISSEDALKGAHPSVIEHEIASLGNNTHGNTSNNLSGVIQCYQNHYNKMWTYSSTIFFNINELS